MPYRVLVTGHNGYIGSVLSPWLKSQGHKVRGLDIGYFRDCSLYDDDQGQERWCDVRDLTADLFQDVDAVVHLAALSNDPIGNLSEAWTKDINLDGTIKVAEMAKAAGVRRFLFSSSCIMYGSADAGEVDEHSPLDPKTEYARSKVAAEAALADLADDTFSPVFIRNGTVYGLSPRMRLDTVLNNLVAQAVVSKQVVLYSKGTQWRPVVHVKDLVRTFQLFLEAPTELVHNQAFNNGAGHLNHTILELAEIVAEVVPGTQVEIRAEKGADERTYRAKFSKFANAFPAFSFNWTPKSGAKELYTELCRIGFSSEHLEGDHFVRLRWLKHLLDSRHLTSELRWANM